MVTELIPKREQSQEAVADGEHGNPLVSVIIPTHNSRKWIGRAIRSVLAQDYKPIEVIVVDDGSTDGTYEYLAGAYPEIRLIRQRNAGQSAARNRGAEAASAGYLAFLDADDLWFPGKLGLQMEAIRNIAGWGICGTGMLKFYPNQIPVPPPRRKRPKIRELSHRGLFTLNEVYMSSVVLNRAAFLEAGGFNEEMRVIEDWELWLRISKNWGVFIIDRPLFGYQRTPGSVSADKVKVQEGRVKILKGWRGDYPEYVARLLSRAQISLARKLLRAGRLEEARAVFFGEDHSGKYLAGRVWFSFLATMMRWETQLRLRLEIRRKRTGYLSPARAGAEPALATFAQGRRGPG